MDSLHQAVNQSVTINHLYTFPAREEEVKEVDKADVHHQMAQQETAVIQEDINRKLVFHQLVRHSRKRVNLHSTNKLELHLAPRKIVAVDMYQQLWQGLNPRRLNTDNNINICGYNKLIERS